MKSPNCITTLKLTEDEFKTIITVITRLNRIAQDDQKEARIKGKETDVLYPKDRIDCCFYYDESGINPRSIRSIFLKTIAAEILLEGEKGGQKYEESRLERAVLACIKAGEAQC
jgi:hypothetical protein